MGGGGWLVGWTERGGGAHNAFLSTMSSKSINLSSLF